MHQAQSFGGKAKEFFRPKMYRLVAQGAPNLAEQGESK